MNNETFERLINEIREKSIDTLFAKNAGYSNAEDRLHNFRSGAEMTGQTLAQTAWGYMAKHLVALRDKVYQDDFSDRDDLMEKCQDIINYICFIWVCGNETMEQRIKNAAEEGTISESFPVKTYRDVVLERFPNSSVTADGRMIGCPGSFFSNAPNFGGGCIVGEGFTDCTTCWNSPYQGEKWRDQIDFATSTSASAEGMSVT